MTRVHLAIYLLLGAALAVSVVTDLRTRKILNIVTYPTIGLCLLLRLAGNGWGAAAGAGLASGLIGLAVAASLFLVLNLMGGMGLGDVKLAAAVGAGVGFPSIIACLIFIAIAGGLEALVVLVWKGRLLQTLGGMARRGLQAARVIAPDTSVRERTRIPYGIAIALGTAWGMWWVLSQEPPLAAP